ncbi:CDP-diacylglycerol--serine O-phosphatidyltransferase [uncultured Tateyamaria sp.]|uniref:CDP-diacylglycerol--serine O-phosphatidyltransferase n=1 Tax=uncultured Tateyamaria sp. TaxID=455651 RepID=UPI00260CCF52|nr:CDP-diacylglycerol--serine O-phosphatidyltransferase [uncultured Tateyamaria sp.]
MVEPSDRDKKSQIRPIDLLPNLITIAAIFAGLTAIRFGYEARYEMAVRLVLAACVLEGLDGRVARLLNRSTAVGAELDSLADFLNFGVAPVLILYSWACQDFRSAGWIAVLFYAICRVLRLARFNVSDRVKTCARPSAFFVGVPSPAGAVLVMLPMVVSFAVSDMPLTPPVVVAFHICLVGLLMISRIPTYSFKNISMNRANAKFFLLGVAVLAAALLTYLWATLTLLTLAYVVCLVWAYRTTRRSKPTEG